MRTFNNAKIIHQTATFLVDFEYDTPCKGHGDHDDRAAASDILRIGQVGSDRHEDLTFMLRDQVISEICLKCTQYAERELLQLEFEAEQAKREAS